MIHVGDMFQIKGEEKQTKKNYIYSSVSLRFCCISSSMLVEVQVVRVVKETACAT